MTTFTMPCKMSPGKNLEVPAIFLTASPSNAMKGRGPKFLFPTKSGLLGERQLKLLQSNFPMIDPIICVGHDARDILNLQLGVKIVENGLWETTAEIEQLRLCLNIIPNAKRVLIIQGDSLFPIPRMIINQSSLMYSSQASKEAGLNIKENMLVTTGTDFPNKPNGPIYLETNELQILRDYCNAARNRNAELWEFLKRLESFGGKVFCYEGNCMRATSSEDLELLETL